MQLDVRAALGALFRSQAAFGDDVEDPEPSAGPQDAAVSGTTAALSVDRLITQFEMTTSTAASGRGISSMIL